MYAGLSLIQIKRRMKEIKLTSVQNEEANKVLQRKGQLEAALAAVRDQESQFLRLVFDQHGIDKVPENVRLEDGKLFYEEVKKD